MRASTATTPSGLAITGFMSISTMVGSSQAISDTRSSISRSAASSTAGAPRVAFSRRAARVREIRRATRKSFSGGSATSRSRNTSTSVPPRPKLTTGPNTSSRTMPIISSRPCLPRHIGSTTTPLMRASGRCLAIEVISSWNTERTCRALARPRRTPPMSVLCVMSGESIFIATGKPSSCATSIASCAERAGMLCTIGMRKAASTAFDSAWLRMRRPSSIAFSMIRRALSNSGSESRVSGSGTCSNCCWLSW